ncbi:Hypothetical predicted protein [Podarcis lilfordi]|uniref:Uncharacterized protein n=1 Tax=Podarcis lilfordi TaxID=74358 RepID=A0AA35K6Y6_9SAUR|nr:Hypothetical predicted protein [Podarcis lilfordi]
MRKHLVTKMGRPTFKPLHLNPNVQQNIGCHFWNGIKTSKPVGDPCWSFAEDSNLCLSHARLQEGGRTTQDFHHAVNK